MANDYDGIDIDYEALSSSDRQGFSNFIKDLAEALHRKNKKLAVNLAAKTSDEETGWTPDAQDWSVVGQYADEVRIMAYEYSSVHSGPGPIAPVDWVRQVLEYARENIPLEKIILGIPFYGHDWSGGSAVSLVWQEAVDLNREFNFDEPSQSPWFEYLDDLETAHQVWFENSASVSAKINLAREFKIGGINFWRLGGEDPAVWSRVKEYQESQLGIYLE